MTTNYGLNRYKQTSITTAGRGQIIIMLYEGCIKSLKKASDAITAKNLAEKGVCIGKAQDIINELNNSLNHDVGGEISKELERLYDYIFDLTTKANIDNDAASIDQAMRLLDTLLDGWRTAVAKSGHLVNDGPTSNPSNNNSRGPGSGSNSQTP